jgi:hypothetical protein
MLRPRSLASRAGAHLQGIQPTRSPGQAMHHARWEPLPEAEHAAASQEELRRQPGAPTCWPTW